MKKLIIAVLCLGIMVVSFNASAYKPKNPNSSIFKIKYDGECINYIVHAYGNHYDSFMISIEGIYLPTRKSAGFSASDRFRLPKGMTKDGIKGSMCGRSIPNHRDRQNIKINVVLYKNGKIIDRVCGYSGRGARTSWGCR